MLFNSIQFIIFFALFLAAYLALSDQKHRKLLLLVGSLYFYSVWSIPYTGLMLASIVINYFSSQAILSSQNKRDKKLFLLLSIVFNLGILFFFKYYGFFSIGLAQPMGLNLPTVDWLLPMGISFYTFQSLSCTIDVYRGNFSGKYSLVDYALYISFFPQLVAGPIMRAADLMPQFSKKQDITADRILEGCFLACWGLIQKVFLATPLGSVVDSVYDEYGLYSGAALVLATYAFALQIYFDFSGYTDVARGVGKALGFEIMENFNAPYLASSLRDFWRRWHISLSTWLKDYLYIPLGGSRRGFHRTGINLLVTMLLGGLWHGAAWTFVIWGGLHGVFLYAERVLLKTVPKVTFFADREFSGAVRRLARRLAKRLGSAIAILITFHLVCLSWVFFRSENLSQAIAILTRVASWSAGESAQIWPLYILGGLLVAQLTLRKFDWVRFILAKPALMRWSVYASTVLLVIALSGSQTAEFIYFQF
jgi:alginate O-acetyltransferase complex protein AlgI